jgi:predicted ATPase
VDNVKLVEWMINKPQVDRITAHLDLLATYNEQRNALREPIERFLKLLNQFLSDTGKKVVVSDNGTLRVKIGNVEGKSIGSLSSGERQLVVMLGHLTLNKRLTGSGVFIIDEPELSLHISWQERFVDSIREANGAVQIVMATHSPAIILERDEHCESLDRRIVA